MRRTQSTSDVGGLLPGGEGKSSHSMIRRFFDFVASLFGRLVPERFSTSSVRKVF